MPGETEPGDDRLTADETARPTDDALLDRVLEALRSSDVAAGERLRGGGRGPDGSRLGRGP